MKAKKISKSTTNRGEFNRAYKEALERKGKIRCSYCGYHRGENKDGKWYGGYVFDNTDIKYEHKSHIRYPNWKLVSKNKKQWMKKFIKKETSYSERFKYQYINITW